MKTIELKAFTHNNQLCLGICFTRDIKLNKAIRQLLPVRWTKTYQCWYLPFNAAHVATMMQLASADTIIDSSAISSYMAKQDLVTTLQKIVASKSSPPALPDNSILLHVLCAENIQALELLIQQLVLKAYSPSTIRTYRNEFLQLLQLLRQRPVNELSPAQIKKYMVYAMEKQGISENTAHSRLNALKFYFEQVLGRDKFFWEVPRPKKQQQNPHFFNQDEIVQIIKHTTNLKHKTMLMLAYGTGMRVSEVTHLKVWQVDSKRMQVIIQQAKGKKDRITTLSPVLLVMLREYFTAFTPARDGYLFCGQYPGEPYSSRALQLVVQAAKQKAGILKPGSVHALRHSFATHLLDRGTDVTLIMKLLGHNDIKTTMRYLHVTNRDVLQIISPLDQLNL